MLSRTLIALVTALAFFGGSAYAKDTKAPAAAASASSSPSKVDKKAERRAKKAEKEAAKASEAAPAATATTAKSDVKPAAKGDAKSGPTAATATNTKTAAGNTDVAGATAKCKDGSYSHAKGHAGACSRHGGVAEWLAK